MRQAGMVRAGGRMGVGNGEEDRKAEDRKAEGGTADGRRTDGREAEGRKRDGGMGKWVRPGGQEKKLGGFVYCFADKRGGYCGLSGGDGGNGFQMHSRTMTCSPWMSFSPLKRKP